MALDVKEISLWDTLRLHVFVVAPAALWGLVAPNRLFVSWLSKRDAGRRTADFLDGLRKKYQCEHLWSWFLWWRTLLVLDRQSIDAVLMLRRERCRPATQKARAVQVDSRCAHHIERQRVAGPEAVQ